MHLHSMFSEQVRLSPERVELIKQVAKKKDVYDRLANAIAPAIYENLDVKRGNSSPTLRRNQERLQQCWKRIFQVSP